jgi:hypothetical protein
MNGPVHAPPVNPEAKITGIAGCLETPLSHRSNIPAGLFAMDLHYSVGSSYTLARFLLNPHPSENICY